MTWNSNEGLVSKKRYLRNIGMVEIPPTTLESNNSHQFPWDSLSMPERAPQPHSPIRRRRKSPLNSSENAPVPWRVCPRQTGSPARGGFSWGKDSSIHRPLNVSSLSAQYILRIYENASMQFSQTSSCLSCSLFSPGRFLSQDLLTFMSCSETPWAIFFSRGTQTTPLTHAPAAFSERAFCLQAPCWDTHLCRAQLAWSPCQCTDTS